MNERMAQQHQLTSLLESHKQQQKQLIAERQQLLQKNANLLRGYIQAGLNLPVSGVIGDSKVLWCLLAHLAISTPGRRLHDSIKL